MHTTLDLPEVEPEQLAPDVREVFGKLLAGQHLAQTHLLLQTDRSPARLRRDYWLAVSGTAAFLVAGLAASIWVGRTASMLSGVMIAAPTLFLSTLLWFIWPVRRKRFARDPLWSCGLVASEHLVMRDEGVVRYLALGEFAGARVHTTSTDGVETDRSIVLYGSGGEIRWPDLGYFGSDLVGDFTYGLHTVLEQMARDRMIEAAGLDQRVALFARGGAVAEPLRFCETSEQGMRSSEIVDVYSDGRVTVSMWNPEAGAAEVVAEVAVTPDEVRGLAQIWCDHTPTFEHLPPFIPSHQGAILFSVAQGEESIRLHLPGNAYDHATVRALREGFRSLRRAVPYS